MGLDSFNTGPEITEGTTISELISIFGEEQVRRGVQYMDSLAEAEENYKNSEGDYSEKFTESVQGEAQKVDRLDDKWAEAMEENGLGLE